MELSRGILLAKRMWRYKNLSIKARKLGKHEVSRHYWLLACNLHKLLGGNGVV